MLQRYPFWKYLLIVVVLVVGTIYALPNLYPEEPAVQISGQGETQLTPQDLSRATQALDQAGISVKQSDMSKDGRSALIRLTNISQQAKAKELVGKTLGDNYVAALSLADATPAWLRALGASPMTLGLDLRGGVHFMLDVDMQAALTQRLNTQAGLIRQLLRDDNLRTLRNKVENGQIVMSFTNEDDLNQAKNLITSKYSDSKNFTFTEEQRGRGIALTMTLKPAALEALQNYAVEQNLTTLSNRVNELGLAEPIVQRVGENHILVELPGIQDTAAAKRVVGATANLEFRIAATPNTPETDVETVPFRGRSNQPGAPLQRDVIITGDQVSSASYGLDERGQPMVNIELDSAGGASMLRATKDNVRNAMAVIYIEHKSDDLPEGASADTQRHTRVERGIISLATINSQLGSKFQISGLRSSDEAKELSLLLRSGSLAAPIYFSEESTIGPSLGQQNIDRGVMSVGVALAMLIVFMILRYKGFGVIATIALIANLALLLALMSVLGATLTMPGIAGIVLALAMAVDGNVLIFERIREEQRTQLAPLQAIQAGYDRALTSIVDSQLTTLLVAIILYKIGTGPVRGFAATTAIGIITSVFTSVTLSRALTHIAYGYRRTLKRLWI